MKNTVRKSIAFTLVLLMAFAAVFSAQAANFSETKASAFIKKFAAEKSLTVKMEDIEQGSLSANDIILSAKLNDKDSLDIKASATAKVSFLSANAYYDGKDLTAYFWIFKVNASDLAKNVLGSDIFLSEEQLSDMAGAFKDIAKIANSPLLAALNVDSQTDSAEKFSVSAMSLLISMSGASEETIQAAMAAAGHDTKDKTDKEIKDTLVELNKAGALLPILKAAGSNLTQEDLDFCMEYIYDSFEFSYKGNDIKDIAVYDENGAEVFRLSKLIPFSIDSIAAGEGNVKSAPSFGIDITGLVSGILKSLIG
ncbi:MAG: hypothetical protein K6F64_07330 [Clostridia bacterium]|nr:hypothetical protein [Clostridia bacterium]